MQTCYLGEGSCMGSAMLLMDRALLSSYRLSMVTILLCVTFWSQFAMQILSRGFV